jgi:hypothetical protein
MDSDSARAVPHLKTLEFRLPFLKKRLTLRYCLFVRFDSQDFYAGDMAGSHEKAPHELRSALTREFAIP